MKVFCVFLLTALCTNRATSATTLLEGDNTFIANSLPIISCAFKWAESPDSLFIFAKFSHKLYCKPDSNISCTERHPHYDIVRKWVTNDVASVVEPPRKHSKHRKHNNEIPCVTPPLK